MDKDYIYKLAITTSKVNNIFELEKGKYRIKFENGKYEDLITNENADITEIKKVILS